MAIQFDNLPKEKPGKVTPGRFLTTITKVENTISQAGNENLVVHFQTTEGDTIKEWFQDLPSKFVQYKLQRLLTATKVTLTGQGTLKDVGKVVLGKKVLIDVGLNDKGYGILDFSGNNEGLYAAEVPTEPDADIANAITDDDIAF